MALGPRAAGLGQVPGGHEGHALTVGVIQYGMGNLGSVLNMFRRIEVDARLVSTPEEVAASDRLLLPGVGAFDQATARLEGKGLTSAIRDFAATGKPVLGVCLGMQLLMDSSAEGVSSGLGLIEGTATRFEPSAGVRVPHMGWNTVTPARPDALFDELDDPRFYFVHSYHVVPTAPEHVLARTPHGAEFTSMVRRDNIAGAQFHPEKSHAFGMRLLTNFAAA
ncbi:imidazole glycerol phosphate synthase subunit HisH [Microbacterium sp. NPDC055910]|uniref:imidazole glycerol phosphate synthase subunit HisH n=1 Tax=Microbacterium sp. NPDC055910 TaxID=3345659 RepID=UPI0035D870D2